MQTLQLKALVWREEGFNKWVSLMSWFCKWVGFASAEAAAFSGFLRRFPPCDEMQTLKLPALVWWEEGFGWAVKWRL
ncbi:hypothetical protein FF2_010553 [Malus domestica]